MDIIFFFSTFSSSDFPVISFTFLHHSIKNTSGVYCPTTRLILSSPCKGEFPSDLAISVQRNSKDIFYQSQSPVTINVSDVTCPGSWLGMWEENFSEVNIASIYRPR